MTLTGDILRAYSAPRAMVKELLSRGLQERQLLFFAMLFCFLSFVALWPSLSRQALEAGPDGDSFAKLAGAQFVGSVSIGPIALYALAAISHLVLQMLGGRATWRQARFALFWSALVAIPLVLLTGIASATIPGTAATTLSVVTGVVFLWQWGIALHEVEFVDQ